MNVNPASYESDEPPTVRADDNVPSEAPVRRAQFALRHIMLAMLWLSGLLATATQVSHYFTSFVVLCWLGITWVCVCRRSASVPVVLPGLCLLGTGVVTGLSGSIDWLLESNAEPPIVQIPFVAEAWKRADPIEKFRTVRIQMIDDVQKRNNFNGWSRTEIIDLLGESDWIPPAMRGGWQMAYRLGKGRGFFALDDEFLVFRFDRQGKVISYGVVEE